MSAEFEETTVMLTGATSQLGVFLLPRLIESGFRVLALSRRATVEIVGNDANPLWIGPDFLAGEPLEQNAAITIAETRFLISCGPLELAIETIKNCGKLRRLVIFSTSSVFSKASSGSRAEREQVANILEREDELKTLVSESSLELIILRPTLIYGCGLDRNISLLANWISRFGWLPVSGDAAGLRQPVHADDLAELAVNALKAKQSLALDSAACGGNTLSYRQMAELIFDSLGRPRRFISIPSGVFSFILNVAALTPFTGKMNSQMVKRQSVDLVFDDTPLRQALGYNPRPFKPTATDYQVPASAAKYQL